MSVKSSNNKKLLKIDQEKESKKRASELSDRLDAMGQENEQKAAKVVIEYGKETEEQERERHARALGIITSARKNDNAYCHALKNYWERELMEIDWPQHYMFSVSITDRGIAGMMKTPLGRYFGKGIAPVYDANYDVNAIDVLVIQMENTLDRLENRKFKTVGGIGGI